jgi:predicted nucleotidyltransferase
MRANPQVLALLIICLVLGIGTFLIVLFGIAASGSGTTNGEPSGVLALAHALL